MSTNPLEALLLAGAAANRFPQTSRYHGVDTNAIELPGGRTVAYLRRRFAPQPSDLALLHTLTVADGDRLDILAAEHLGDPELFWRLADANAALRPDDLIEIIGRELRVTLPEGTPGPVDG